MNTGNMKTKKTTPLIMVLLISTLIATLLIFSLRATAADTTINMGVNELSVSYDSSNTVEISNTSQTGFTLELTKAEGCNAGTGTVTITFKNTAPTVRNISFKYNLVRNSGSATVFGANKTADGDYTTGTVSLSSNDSKTIVLTTQSTKSAASCKITISDLTYVDPNATSTVTVNGAANGTIKATYSASTTTDSITHSGALTTKNYSVSSTNTLSLQAVPDSGYRFYAFVDQAGNYLTKESTYAVPNKTATITALFVPENAAVFKVDQKEYFDLQSAINAISSATTKRIIVTGSGVVGSGTYNLPANTTLSVPYDDTYTDYGASNLYVGAEAKTRKAFVRLTLSSGVTLNVPSSSTINVGSRVLSGCQTTGTYGQIHMESGSEINLNSAKLYAWGYITGTGHIYAKESSNVYEVFQYSDWRGGNATSDVATGTGKVFPFNQYYIQNIEAYLTLYKNAKETVYTVVATSGFLGGIEYTEATPVFFGSGGVFVLTGNDAYMTKYYDPAVDKIYLDIYDDAELQSIVMDVYVTVDSAEYVLPINNMIVTQHSGTLSTNNKIMLLADSGMIIEEGAALSLGTNSEGYVIDVDDWDALYSYNNDGKTKLKPVPYSPSFVQTTNSSGVTTVTQVRTTAKMKDGFLRVNGTVDAEGVLATTVSGAEISSPSGKGTVTFHNTNTGTLQQAYQNNNQGGKDRLCTVAALLQNQDGSYRSSVIRENKETTFYVNNDGKWVCGDLTVDLVWKDRDGNTLYSVKDVPEDQIGDHPYAGVIPESDLDIPDPNPNANSVYHEFIGWNTSYDFDSSTVTYNAEYKERQYYLITWNDNSNNTLGTAYVPYMKKPSDYRPLAVLEYIDEYYLKRNKSTTANIAFANGNFYDTGVINTSRTFTASDSSTNYKYLYYYYQNKYTSASTIEAGTATTGASYKKVGTTYTPAVPSGNNKLTKDTKYSSYGDFLGWYITSAYGHPIDSGNEQFINYDMSTKSLLFSCTPSEAYAEGKIKVLHAKTAPNADLLLAGVTVDTSNIVLSATLRCYPVYALTSTPTYKVTFKNGSTTIGTPADLTKGAEVTPPETEPTKASTARYDYQFSGWKSSADGKVYTNANIPSVSGTVTYTAQFTEAVRSYSVTWKNYDDTQLKSETVEYGLYPTAPTATKAADNTYSYTLSGWDPAVEAVTENATYKAEFRATYNEYDITWKRRFTLASDSTQTQEEVILNEKKHWNDKLAIDASIENNDEYTFVFVNWTDDSGNVVDGLNTPIITDANNIIVTGNATYTANFRAIPKYTITWSIDGVSTEETYELDAAPTHADPTKEKDINYSYTFAGWSTDGTTVLSSLPNVTADATYIAVFTAKSLEPQHSLTLDGEIGVNFYIPKDVVDDKANSTVKMSWGPEDSTDPNHGEATFAISELTDNNEGNKNVAFHQKIDEGSSTKNPLAKAKINGDYYQFTAFVAAKQMADDVTVTIYDGGKESTDTYRVADYCYEVIANAKDAGGKSVYDRMHAKRPEITEQKFTDLQNLCKAMLTYGAKAQDQFSYNNNDEGYADKDLTDYTYLYTCTADTFSEFYSTDYASGAGDMTYYGSSMQLEAETTYTVWLRYTNTGYEPPEATATVKGEEVPVDTIKVSGDYGAYHYVRYNILNLPANLLTEPITVSYNGVEGARTYNAQTYFYIAMVSGNDTLKNTIASLYNYNQAAVKYFG